MLNVRQLTPVQPNWVRRVRALREFIAPFDEVAGCPHPAVGDKEVGKLAAKVEMMREWKGPAHLDAAIRTVRALLDRHTP